MKSIVWSSEAKKARWKYPASFVSIPAYAAGT
jgi:hypothetical protein